MEIVFRFIDISNFHTHYSHNYLSFFLQYRNWFYNFWFQILMPILIVTLITNRSPNLMSITHIDILTKHSVINQRSPFSPKRSTKPQRLPRRRSSAISDSGRGLSLMAKTFFISYRKLLFLTWDELWLMAGTLGPSPTSSCVVESKFSVGVVTLEIIHGHWLTERNQEGKEIYYLAGCIGISSGWWFGTGKWGVLFRITK